MRKTLIASSVVAALSVPAIAFAEDAPAATPSPFTGNVTLASEYIYRGIGQTNRKPAVQGGFDYAHPSGFYVGTWGSSISWLGDAGMGSYNMEWDIYGGYKTEVAKDLTLDVGGLEYYYPGQRAVGMDGSPNPNTFEVYGALTYKWITAKYSHSTTNLFGFADSKNSGYLDIAGNLDLGNGYSAQAHVGHQTVKNFGDASYSDYKFGITKDLGVGALGVAFWGSNAKGDAGQPYYNAYGRNLGSSRVLVTFTKSL
jgi:uncharacterized protein (TIGR02001 family)